MFDAAERAGEDRAAAVEGVPVHGLPVVHDARGVLADQVGLQLRDGRGDGQRAPFEDRLAQADEAFVGVDLEEQPARLDQEGLQLGDFHAVSVLSDARWKAEDSLRE